MDIILCGTGHGWTQAVPPVLACLEIGVEEVESSSRKGLGKEVGGCVETMMFKRFHERQLGVDVVLPQCPFDKSGFPFKDTFIDVAKMMEFMRLAELDADDLSGPAPAELVHEIQVPLGLAGAEVDLL